jgi:hypothetical protein
MKFNHHHHHHHHIYIYIINSLKYPNVHHKLSFCMLLYILYNQYVIPCSFFSISSCLENNHRVFSMFIFLDLLVFTTRMRNEFEIINKCYFIHRYFVLEVLFFSGNNNQVVNLNFNRISFSYSFLAQLFYYSLLYKCPIANGAFTIFFSILYFLSTICYIVKSNLYFHCEYMLYFDNRFNKFA